MDTLSNAFEKRFNITIVLSSDTESDGDESKQSATGGVKYHKNNPSPYYRISNCTVIDEKVKIYLSKTSNNICNPYE
jgi:hypothetical protein